MPRFDKTGPNGQGPLSGRGLGDCATDNSRSRFIGRGRGRGTGRGFRRFGVSNETPSLQEEKSYLEARLNDINQELDK